jgi:hypothetical protein
LAPEAEQKLTGADSYERRGRFVEGLAGRMLEAVARGEGVRESDVIALASAVLTAQEVKLAMSVFADDRPRALTDAIELARLVRERTATVQPQGSGASVQRAPARSGRGNYPRVRRVTR